MAVAIVAVALAGVGMSRASYTTSSTSQVTATAAGASGWLHMYSASTDPDTADQGGYATMNGVTPATVCASGLDTSLAVDWGRFPDSNPAQRVTFTRAFTFRTATTFPVSGVTQVTISASFTAPSGQNQIIQSVVINGIGQTGGSSSVTLGVNQKCQVDVMVMYKKQMADPGPMRSDILLTLTYSGGPASYYQFDVPATATIY